MEPDHPYNTWILILTRISVTDEPH